VPLELSELAAGLPFAASFAMAGGISALKEGRRRTALNEAIHELRRPLQAIALAAHSSTERAGALESSLRMATAAVDRLDCEINGRPGPEGIGAVPLRQLVEAAVERWRARASLEKRELSLKWEVGDPCLPVDEVQLAQALDNLISNGLDHGSGEVAVVVNQIGAVLRLAVVNRKRDGLAVTRRRTRALWAGLSGRRRHGHGLRIVRRLAGQSDGSFRLRQRGDRCEALLELSLCGGPR
jgi:signal transduction histidine kinase